MTVQTTVDTKKMVFNSLGEVSFKPRTDDTGKHELKTVFVESEATFIRLVVSENHPNISLNPRNQVGIVNLAIFGYVTEKPNPMDAEDDEVDEELDRLGRAAKGDFGSMIGVGYSRNLDGPPGGHYSKELEDMIGMVQKQKARAVKEEKFRQAKKAHLEGTGAE
uniref:DUF4316 domain-containing protein n=1 Tax=Panagrellus redivivus TaxID=6233 RepID=A0A7E4UYX9_PANRE